MRKLTVGLQASMILALSFGLQAQQVLFTGNGATDRFEAANPGATLFKVDQGGATYRNGKSYTLVTGPGLVYQNGTKWQIAKPQIQELPNNGGWQLAQTAVPVVLTGLDATKKTRKLKTGSGSSAFVLELPDVAYEGGNAFTFPSDGQVWRLLLQQTGTLLTATVTKQQGSKYYSFGYDASGPALSIDLKGNLITGGLRITRPTIITADKKTVPCSAWDTKGNRIGFTCDDSKLTAAAFPYVIDPATIGFGASSLSCDGYDDGSWCHLHGYSGYDGDHIGTFTATFPISMPSNATITDVNIGTDGVDSVSLGCDSNTTSSTTTTPSGTTIHPNQHLDWFNLHGQSVTWTYSVGLPSGSTACWADLSDSPFARITYLAPPTVQLYGQSSNPTVNTWDGLGMVVYDGDGSGNLSRDNSPSVIINSTPNYAGGCNVYFYGSIAYLLDDAGNRIGGVGPSQNTQVSSSVCAIRGNNFQEILGGCGTGCTGYVAFQFEVQFFTGGSRNIYVNARNLDNLSTGWTNIGALNIPIPQISHTLLSNPAGRSLTIDGSACVTPCAVQWLVGSTHTIAAPATQPGSAGTQFVFGSWSDGGGISHTVIGASSGVTYTANLTTQYYLTTAAGTAGTIIPGSAWYNSGSVVAVGAQANAGYQFTGFSGGLSGTATPQNVTVTAPVSVSAAFGAVVSHTIITSPAGRGLTIDGSACTAPCTFQWLTGSSHTLATATPQAGTAGTQYVFASWSQGGAATQSVTAAASATTYTANFTTQYYLTDGAGAGGSVAPASGWQNSGVVVPVSVTANAGYQFSGFSGDLTGTTTPQSVTMTAPRSVTAAFLGIQTVASAPTGLSITVDGTACTTPCTFQWLAGSSHAVAAPAMLAGPAGTQYVFTSWSQGGAATQSITAVSTPMTYTVTYKTQYYLTTSAGTGGTILPASGWYDSGASASVSAPPNASYYLMGFSGDLSGATTPQGLTMNAAKSITAAFALMPTATVGSSPVALAIMVDGGACTTPCTFQWTPGTSHTLAAGTVAAGAGTQYVFASWSQGGAATQSVTAAASATTYTANFTTQYYLTDGAGAGGSVAPASGWQNSGVVVPVSVTANAGYQFSGFSGDLTGTTTPQNVTMTAPKSVTVGFTAVVSVQILNLTRGGTSVLRVGDSWRITVTGPANQSVTWSGVHDGAAVGTTAGSTDASGNYALNDTMTAGSLGDWTEAWCVGGVAASPALSFTVINAVQTSISVIPNGTFSQGQSGASYAVTVTNQAGSPTTSGTVTVTETLPPGLTLVTMGGSGWTCSTNSCTRNDALASGASYLAITVTVNVAPAAGSPQVNQVRVSGGGALADATATHSTVILGPPASVLASPPGASGHKQIFSLVWSDPVGATNISTFQVKFAVSSASTVNTCWVSFDRAAGQIKFHNDQGTELAPVPFGSAAALQNSQCIVYPSESSVGTTGNQLTLTLSMAFLYGFSGAQPIWMRASNTTDSGWGSSLGAYTVTDTAPAVMGVSPSAGRGWMQTFAFTYSDADGAGDFSNVQLLFGSALSATHSCYMLLGNGLTGIYLADDSGSWQPSLTAGMQGTRQNSQCSVDGAGSSVIRSGNNLTLNVNVTFASAFAGAKSIWSVAYDNALASNGWVNSGMWTVGPLQDYTVSATPASATVLAGQPASYTVNLTTINGFNGTMAFTVSGLPSGATASFSPVSNGSSTMRVTTATAENGGPAGEYDITISGSSNGLSRATTVHVSVQDFVVSVSPAVINTTCSSYPYKTLTSTNSVPLYQATVNGVNGFAGNVNIFTPSIYLDTTPQSFLSDSVIFPTTVSANGGISQISEALYLSNNICSQRFGVFTAKWRSAASGDTPVNHYPSANLGVNVDTTPDITLQVLPAAGYVQNISPNGTANYQVGVTSQFGYLSVVNGPVNLAVTGLPPGWGYSFYPATISVNNWSPGVTTLTITPPAGAANTNASFTATATGTGTTASPAVRQVHVTSGPSQITVLTVPDNLTLVGSDDLAGMINPSTCTHSPCVFTGNSHYINTNATQSSLVNGDTQFVFQSWEDGSIALPRLINSVGTYTATFKTQYRLTMTPSTGGTITPTTNWYDAGAVVTLTATPSAGYQFAGWSSSVSNSVVTMSLPQTVTATFVPIGSTTIMSNVPGRSVTVDGTAQPLPYTISGAVATVHPIIIGTPQGSGTTRSVFASWSDGFTGASRDITIIGATTTYTLTFNTEFQLTMTPGIGGNLSATPNNGGGWYAQGSSVQVTATVNSGYQFTAFGGALTGTANSQNLLMDAPKTVTATFGQLSTLKEYIRVNGRVIAVDVKP